MLTDIGLCIKQIAANVWMGDSGAGPFVLFVSKVLNVRGWIWECDGQTGWSIMSMPWNTII
jgi:hypothetical protein